MLAHRKGGYGTYTVTDLDVAHSGPHCVYTPGRLIAESRGRFGGIQVLSLPEHDLGTVEADGLHVQADFALTRLGKRQVFDLQHLRSARYMKANDLWHGGFPVKT
jgi:hypothetical protein